MYLEVGALSLEIGRHLSTAWGAVRQPVGCGSLFLAGKFLMMKTAQICAKIAVGRAIV
jgi:hypothetical protein